MSIKVNIFERLSMHHMFDDLSMFGDLEGVKVSYNGISYDPKQVELLIGNRQTDELRKIFGTSTISFFISRLYQRYLRTSEKAYLMEKIKEQPLEALRIINYRYQKGDGYLPMPVVYLLEEMAIPESFDLLFNMLKKRKEIDIANVISILNKINGIPRVIQLLRTELKSRDPSIRGKAASLLGEIGDRGKEISASAEVIPELIELLALADEDWDFVVKVSNALDIIGKAGVKQEPQLVRLLSHNNNYVRNGAVQALGKMNALSKEAFQALKNARKDSDADVRYSAERAVENFKKNKKWGIF